MKEGLHLWAKKKVMDLSQEIRLSQKQKLYLGMVVSQFMHLSSGDFWSLVRDLEEDPLFIKLYGSPEQESKAIRINPRRFHLRLDEGIKTRESGWQAQVEILLFGREKFLEKLKAIGRDRFVSLFLSGDASVLEISEATGLSVDEIREFQDKVLDRIFIQDQFSPEPLLPPADKYEIIGIVEVQDGIPVFQPIQEKERYSLNSDTLDEMVNRGILTEEEISRLPDILRKINLVNLRTNLVSTIGAYLVDVQKSFLLTGDEKKMEVMEGKDLASKLDIDPSWLSRLIRGKMIRTPVGIIPLRKFFLTRRNARKRQGKELLAKLLQTYPGKRPSDRILAEELKKQYNLNVSRRTVNLWRKEMEEENP
ncbi:MAG: hypothetical protein J7M18_02850 [Candidatus Eremiobacteraeota bacterium]|nr:hypothetical protein [Candidatus Eremiobacteraeota bacterium]